MSEEKTISKSKIIFGGAILIIGFCGPLFIPLVNSSGLSIGLKTTLSGLLVFGIPEVFMWIAVAVMGRQGYELIKNKIIRYLGRLAPPDHVSLWRYRIGLGMFCLPLLLGWIQPYLISFFPNLEALPLWSFAILDFIFLASFFVLGGVFWDKFSSLFRYSSDRLASCFTIN